jgi:O-methyltransferase involved in polyketide biosynthesis
MTKSEEVVGGKYGDQREGLQKRAVVVEARFKAVSRLINKAGSRNVLELASGVSPRGLIMTEDPSVTYIETDLPEMLREKADLAHDLLLEENMIRPNLHFLAVNALDDGQLRKAVSLTNGELTIAQEGLFVYMPRRDQQKVAKNILGILRERGGAWVTDVSLKSEMEQRLDPKRATMVDTLQKEININLQDNAFADGTEVESFFKNAGFSIEDKINLFDMKDSLASPARTNSDQEQLREILETRFIYLLRSADR